MRDRHILRGPWLKGHDSQSLALHLTHSAEGKHGIDVPAIGQQMISYLRQDDPAKILVHQPVLRARGRIVRAVALEQGDGDQLPGKVEAGQAVEATVNERGRVLQ
jgi:hypothetical protein